jgi:tetratricopeptide (TPR) repeat protein
MYGSLYACNGKHAVSMFFFRHRRRLVLRAAFLCLGALSFAAAQSEDLAALSAHGKDLMAQGRFEEAIPVYQSLLKSLPGNPGLILNLGLAEQMAGHPAAAIPQFKSVLKVEPDSIPALTSVAMAYLQLQRPAEAVAPLRRVLTLNAKDINARGMLAGAEMSIGKFDDAASEYRQLTTSAPDDPKSWYGLGKAYGALAEARFSLLSKIAPESGYVALLVADSRLQRRQYRSAFFFYREAEKSTPDLPGLHAGLARVYRETGHADWANAEEQREAKSSNLDCKSQLQACQFLRGNFLEATKAGTLNSATSLFWAARAYNLLAVQAFDQLGKLPESVELHSLKAQILHDHGQDLEAAKEWTAALALAPPENAAQLKFELASSLFLGHSYQAAIPLIQELLSGEPDSPDLNFMLGESLWRTQQAESALPYLQKSLSKSPEMLPAHAALGLALVSLNKNAEAISHLEKAESLDDDGSLHYSLARAYQSTGDTGKARIAMEQYQQIQKRNHDQDDVLSKEAQITAPTPAP